jgi:hypothetical protein
MMNGRSGISRAWNPEETPKLKKNMKILEQPVITRLICTHQKKSSRRIVMKDSVWKTYKRKYCEIQNQKFSQMEGEDYDD